jgi:hypothetical protein
MKTQYKFLLGIALFSQLNTSYAQTNTATPAAKEVDEFAKKKEEIKLTGVIPTDSATVAALMKRATAWAKLEAPTYKKTNATSTSSKLECIASFPVKPKEINPQVDYTGKVTMKVVIECKDSKYRYTVNEIKHISKNGRSSGGSVDLDVPECGSMGMTDIVWKKLRGEMLTGAAKVADDLKIAMSLIPAESPVDEWSHF